MTKSNHVVVVFLMALFIMTIHPEPAAAADLGTALQNIVAMLQGTVARSTAIIAMIAGGIGMMMGFVGWRVLATLVVGIAIVFGAPTLINTIFGG